MKQDQRGPFVEALQRARHSAYAPGEFVGQESFMRSAEILELGRRAGIGRDVSVLDLCCGIAGPGRYLTGQLGCRYLGVDYSASAIEIARELAGNLGCQFEVARIPPLPAGRFEVVLLLETILAFADKRGLLQAVAQVLPSGGRFAFTLEEGSPLSPAERERMPDADTVWLMPLLEIKELLKQVGLQVGWESECTRAHLEMVESLLSAFRTEHQAIGAQIGATALRELLTAHELWRDWLSCGRVRKFALVTEKR